MTSYCPIFWFRPSTSVFPRCTAATTYHLWFLFSEALLSCFISNWPLRFFIRILFWEFQALVYIHLLEIMFCHLVNQQRCCSFRNVQSKFQFWFSSDHAPFEALQTKHPWLLSSGSIQTIKNSAISNSPPFYAAKFWIGLLLMHSNFLLGNHQ